MCRIAKYMLAIVAIICVSAGTAVGQVPLEQAWEELPRYEYGQDLAGQLAIERSVIEAMNTPAHRAEIAARFAAAAESAGHDASRQAVHLSPTAADRDTGRDPAARTTPAITRHLSDGALYNRRHSRPGIDRHAAQRAGSPSRAMRWPA